MVAAPVTTLSGAASTSSRIPKQAVPRRGRWIAIAAAGAVMLAAVIVIVATRGPGAAASKVVSYASVSQPTGAAAPGPASTQPATVPTPEPARVEPDTPKPRVEPDTPQPHVEPAAALAHVEPETPQAPPVAAAPPQPPATPPATPQRPPPEPDKPRAAPAKPQSAATPQRPRVAAATPRPAATAATVEATIDSVPAGAQILLGRMVLGKTPFHGTLPRRDADVTLVIRLAGYAEKSVVVHPDQPVSQHLKLVKSATAHPPKANRDQSVNPFGD